MAHSCRSTLFLTGLTDQSRSPARERPTGFHSAGRLARLISPSRRDTTESEKRRRDRRTVRVSEKEKEGGREGRDERERERNAKVNYYREVVVRIAISRAGKRSPRSDRSTTPIARSGLSSPRGDRTRIDRDCSRKTARDRARTLIAAELHALECIALHSVHRSTVGDVICN